MREPSIPLALCLRGSSLVGHEFDHYGCGCGDAPSEVQARTVDQSKLRQTGLAVGARLAELSGPLFVWGIASTRWFGEIARMSKVNDEYVCIRRASGVRHERCHYFLSSQQRSRPEGERGRARPSFGHCARGSAEAALVCETVCFGSGPPQMLCRPALGGQPVMGLPCRGTCGGYQEHVRQGAVVGLRSQSIMGRARLNR